MIERIDFMLWLLEPGVNPMPPFVVNTALILLTSAMGFLGTVYWNSRARSAEKLKAASDEVEKMRTRLNDVENKLALVNAAVVPISTAFQAILIKELTHFHTPEMDVLLTKVGPPNRLTAEEQQRLGVLLQERTRDLGGTITPSERDAAFIFPIVMKRAQTEQDVLVSAGRLNFIWSL